MNTNRRELILQVVQAGSLLAVTAASRSASAAPSDSWKPSFFNPEQNETMIALGERIVPGSAEASCNRVIDAVLAIDSERNRTQLLAALGAFDEEAQKRNSQPFRALSPQRQDEILASASQPASPLQKAFEVVKEWTADSYWSSQEGRRELGSTGQMAWEAFPNCPSQQ